jgi:hypothetical protein
LQESDAFEANAPDSWLVGSGLEGDDHAGTELAVVCRDEARLLVLPGTDAVSGVVGVGLGAVLSAIGVFASASIAVRIALNSSSSV